MAKDHLQELFDELLHGALTILQLSAAETTKIFKLIAKLERELRGQLAQENFERNSKATLNRVLSNANETIARYYGEMQHSADLAGIARYSVEATGYAFEVALGYEGIKAPKGDYFKSLYSNVLIEGAPSSEWWKAQNADTQFKFASQVRAGMAGGETNEQIISRIVGKSGQPGVMDVTRRNAASLVQTSVQAVANDARRQTFQANDDIIKGIKQVSTLDGHTSLVCVAYSGCSWNLQYEPIGEKKLPYNGGTPRHFKCRSVEIPLTKTFKEMGLDIPEPPTSTRASDEGDTTFDGFLNRKDKAYQDSLLGEGRADLWRDGKITLRDLVNGSGQPRTLDELNALVKKRRGG